jgi:hypothetical protein
MRFRISGILTNEITEFPDILVNPSRPNRVIWQSPTAIQTTELFFAGLTPLGAFS